MSTHTPAPWFCDTFNGYIKADVKSDHRVYVCKLPTGDDCTHPNSAQRESNGRLIAVAPELLGACKSALGNMDCYESPNHQAPRDGCTCTTCELSQRISDLIDRAEGREA